MSPVRGGGISSSSVRPNCGVPMPRLGEARRLETKGVSEQKEAATMAMGR
jgi:hypothetical protein